MDVLEVLDMLVFSQKFFDLLFLLIDEFLLFPQLIDHFSSL